MEKLLINPKIENKVGLKELKHINYMEKILKLISNKDLIFKGGTALMFGYGVDRFSEDLDLDASYNLNINSIINDLKSLNCNINIKKDTSTTKRIMVYFPETQIKIEISLRNIDKKLKYKSFLNKLQIYDCDSIFYLKIQALKNRTTSRDVYDLGFLVENHFNNISLKNKLELFDYLKNQLNNEDELIDFIIDNFADAFDNDSILDDYSLEETIIRLSRFTERMQKYISIDKEIKEAIYKSNSNNAIELLSKLDENKNITIEIIKDILLHKNEELKINNQNEIEKLNILKDDTNISGIGVS